MVRPAGAPFHDGASGDVALRCRRKDFKRLVERLILQHGAVLFQARLGADTTQFILLHNAASPPRHETPRRTALLPDAPRPARATWATLARLLWRLSPLKCAVFSGVVHYRRYTRNHCRSRLGRRHAEGVLPDSPRQRELGRCFARGRSPIRVIGLGRHGFLRHHGITVLRIPRAHPEAEDNVVFGVVPPQRELIHGPERRLAFIPLEFLDHLPGLR
jgi:hypothetical protein